MFHLTEMLETLLLLASFWAKSVDKWLPGCFCALRGWVLAGRRDTSCTFYNNRSLCFSRLKIVFFQFTTNTCHLVYIATQCFSFVNFQTICSSKSLVALVTLQCNESREKAAEVVESTVQIVNVCHLIVSFKCTTEYFSNQIYVEMLSLYCMAHLELVSIMKSDGVVLEMRKGIHVKVRCKYHWVVTSLTFEKLCFGGRCWWIGELP